MPTWCFKDRPLQGLQRGPRPDPGWRGPSGGRWRALEQCLAPHDAVWWSILVVFCDTGVDVEVKISMFLHPHLVPSLCCLRCVALLAL